MSNQRKLDTYGLWFCCRNAVLFFLSLCRQKTVTEWSCRAGRPLATRPPLASSGRTAGGPAGLPPAQARWAHGARWTHEGSWFDIYVFHPRTTNFNRPEWLLHGNRTITKVDFKNAKIECPCLVFAYLDGERIGRAIPYDTQQSKDKEVNLVLEKGNYNIIILNKQGTTSIK